MPQPFRYLANAGRGLLLRSQAKYFANLVLWAKHRTVSVVESIALSDGALYRLSSNPRGWFVEGSYD